MSTIADRRVPGQTHERVLARHRLPLRWAVSTMRRCVAPSHSIGVTATLTSSFWSPREHRVKVRPTLIGQSMQG
jgi:hypothetical protein